MSEIIKRNIVLRESQFNYRIDREGNLVKEKYSYLKDPMTYITILLILAVLFHFVDKKECMEANKALSNYIQDKCPIYDDMGHLVLNDSLPTFILNKTNGTET